MSNVPDYSRGLSNDIPYIGGSNIPPRMPPPTPLTAVNSIISPQSRYSVSFSGSNDISTSSNFPLTGDPSFTISIWLYMRSGSAVMGWGGGGTLGACGLYSGFRGTNIMGLEFAGSNGAWTNQAVSTNAWHHICFTKTPGAINTTTSFYLDGTLGTLNGGTSTGTPNITTGVFKIGSFSSFGNVNASIDDVRIYNRALNATEVGELASGVNPATNDPVLWWKLEEGTGSTTADVSGNSYNGTLNSSPTWSNSIPAPLS